MYFFQIKSTSLQVAITQYFEYIFSKKIKTLIKWHKISIKFSQSFSNRNIRFQPENQQIH